jgi:hypothetical protein
MIFTRFDCARFGLTQLLAVLGLFILAFKPTVNADEVPLPDLVPFSFFTLSNQVDVVFNRPDAPQVAVVYGVTNQGPGNASVYWWDSVWVSTDSSGSGAVQVPEVFYEYWTTNNLSPGAVYWRTNLISLPKTSGTYWLEFRANPSPDLYETTLANNALRASVPVVVNYQMVPPDLKLVLLQAPSEVTGPPGAGVTVVWGVTNQGPGTVTGEWSDAFYLITNSILDPQGMWAGQVQTHGPVNSGTIYWHTNIVRLPAYQDGLVELKLQVDSSFSVYETNEENNSLTVPITFHLAPSPDLAVTQLSAPRFMVGLTNLTIPLSWSVTNHGPGVASAGRMDAALLRSQREPYSFTQTNFYQAEPVEPHQQYHQTGVFQTSVPESGFYVLFMQADAEGGFYEDETENNYASTTIMILKTNDVAVMCTVPGQPLWDTNQFQITVEVFNAGPGQAAGLFVTNELPAEATLISAAPSLGTWRKEGSRIVWDLGTMAGGADASLRCVLQPNPGSAMLTNYASLVRDGVDADVKNNSATNRLIVLSSISNDAFANRVPVAGWTPYLLADNRNATTEPGEPIVENAGKTVWWTWTAPADGTVYLNFESDMAVEVSVYSGEILGNLKGVAGGDSLLPANESFDPFHARAGAKYQIRVDSYYAGQSGTIIGQIWAYPDKPLTLSYINKEIVLNWEGMYILQSSTNISGPYQDIRKGWPITNSHPSEASMFYRLAPYFPPWQ